MKLRSLSNLTQAAPANSTSRFSLSPTPDANDPVIAEEDRLDRLHWEHKAYHDVIQDGGRPSHRPDDTGFDYLYEPQTGIIWYWITVSASRECVFQTQQWHWQDFRKHQDWRRWRYWKPEWFERFVQEVREYRQKKGLEGGIILLQDRKEQSRLQDWVEFQYWEYKKADGFVKERERYAEGVKRQEKRLQAAIDAGEPAEEIEWIRDHSLALMEGGRGGAEIDLERQSVLLKWIDEQLHIIASECQTSANSTPVLENGPPASVGTSLGKRKRSTDHPGHVKDCRRRVEFAGSCDLERSPAKNAVDRNAEAASVHKSQPSNRSNTRHREDRRKPMEACADGESIPVLDISVPMHCRFSPKPTNSARRSRTRATSVQAQRKSHSTRAGLKTSEFRQQLGTRPAEEEVTFQKSKAELETSTLSSKHRSSTTSSPQSTSLERVQAFRVVKPRLRKCTEVLPETTHRGKSQRSSRKGRHRDKPAPARRGKDVAKGLRQKQLTTDAPLRRSRRLAGKPAIGYPEVMAI